MELVDGEDFISFLSVVEPAIRLSNSHVTTRYKSQITDSKPTTAEMSQEMRAAIVDIQDIMLSWLDETFVASMPMHCHAIGSSQNNQRRCCCSQYIQYNEGCPNSVQLDCKSVSIIGLAIVLIAMTTGVNNESDSQLLVDTLQILLQPAVI